MPRARFGLAALSLTILMVAAVTQGLAPPAALADDWRTYHNDRYGTTIDYPSVFKPGTPPGNDDGLAFASADGAEFSVFASYNALDFDLTAFQDFIVKNLGADAVITYPGTATTGLSSHAREGATASFTSGTFCPTARK
jgi:hypothetical protein